MSPISPPTSKLTNSTIDEVCEYNCFQLYIISMLNGCALNSNECESRKEILKRVTQQTFDPGQVLSCEILHNYDADGFVTNTMDKFIVAIDGITCNDGVDHDTPFLIRQILGLFILVEFYVWMYEKGLIEASNNIVLILIVINTFLIVSSKMITSSVFENNNNKDAHSNNDNAMAIWDKITQCTNFQFQFNSQTDILTSSSSISERKLRLQDCTFNNVTAANAGEPIYVCNNTKIHIYNTDINNSDVTSGDVGSICIYQSSLHIDNVTLTISTKGNDGFLYFKDGETLIIRFRTW